MNRTTVGYNTSTNQFGMKKYSHGESKTPIIQHTQGFPTSFPSPSSKGAVTKIPQIMMIHLPEEIRELEKEET
jgi:hypothetical protein